MKIENSERLSYAIMTRDDAEIMYQIDQDPAVMKYINGGELTSREDIENVYIPRMESYTNLEKGWGVWKISTISNNEVIGFILVRPMGFFTGSPQYHNIELGWRFIQKSWGKGYATEAAANVKEAVSKIDEVKLLTAIAMEENLGSINIMKKLGMNYLKTDLHKDPLGDAEVVYYQVEVK